MPSPALPVESVQSPLVKLVAELTPRAFFHLYPHPLYISVDQNTGLVTANKRPFGWKWIPWLMFTGCSTVGIGLSSSVYTLGTELLRLNTTRNLPLFKILAILTMCAGGGAAVFGSLYLIWFMEVLHAFNQVLILEIVCIQEVKAENPRRLGARRSRRQHDKLGLLSMSFLLIAVMLSWIGPPLIIFFDVDPFKFVAEDLLLSHPYQRSISEILGIYAIRFVVIEVGCQEFIRTAFLYAYAVLVCASTSVAILHKLRQLKSSRVGVQLYTRLQIAFNTVEITLSLMSFVIIFTLQVCTVTAIWVPLNAWHILPVSILLITVIVGFGLFTFSAFLFPTLALVGTETRALLKNRRDKHFMTSRNINCANLYYYTWWRAHRPIDVPCLGLFTFGPVCTRDYLNWVVNNVVNASLLVNPELLGLSHLND